MGNNSNDIVGLEYVDSRRGGSWLHGWVSDISLRKPALHARRILRSYPESYAGNLYKLFWGTCRFAEMEETEVSQAWNKLFSEYPKEHFLAAIILGSIAKKRPNAAHIAYQKLQEEFNRKQFSSVRNMRDEFARNLPNAVAHSIRRKAERTGGPGGIRSGEKRRQTREEWGEVALKEANRLLESNTPPHNLASKTKQALKNNHSIKKDLSSVRRLLQKNGLTPKRKQKKRN